MYRCMQVDIIITQVRNCMYRYMQVDVVITQVRKLKYRIIRSPPSGVEPEVGFKLRVHNS